MSERLPLFPLGTVLFPGVPLPLHVFEERYRLLVRDLLEGEPFFGVVAIVEGHEVGAGAARELAAVGCTAQVHEVTELPGGRYHLITVGRDRFRLDSVDHGTPYPTGRVTRLPENPGDVSASLVREVVEAFARYHGLMLAAAPDAGPASALVPGDLPHDPVELSYLVAAGLVADRGVKQRLLAAEDAATRLAAELGLLNREIRLLGSLRSVPVTDFPTGGVNPN
ncbi:LON peptidase substrate-binding domain-containing protein [Rhizohabitans arisaemae]|uniref:LON peptidase substrate-binding domain-containing protein n=1 Tax=Rhizohabitans arisaemae TaxID=2720610 RepID=UPI0024B26B08|nr:LON peptidase substrate-binding domain-containing protein [Rhizohabitans arisaemae]